MRELTFTNDRLCTWEPPKIETRTGELAGDYLVGYAAVFDQWTTLYEDPEFLMREVVRRGAFSAALGERQDVRSLFNHDKNFVLGRSTSGTLSLRELDRGLFQETRLAGSQTIRDLVVTPITRGDISGMSFGFSPRNQGGGQNTNEQEGDNKKTVIKRGGERITIREEGGRIIAERELLSVDLYDVSPVTYPAYKGTSVGLRGTDLGAFKDELKAILADLRKTDQVRRSRAILAAMQLRLAEAG